MNSRIDELEHIIPHLDTLYEQGLDCLHPKTGEIVSDGEYDALRRELYKLKPDSILFTTPTASKLASVVKKVKHHPPMTSISKASHEDPEVQKAQLFKWISDCKKGLGQTLDPNNLPHGMFYQAYKLDGAACSIYYKNGKLVAAGLRPKDGVNGEDVTEQVKYVQFVPQTLKLPLTCCFRGELICFLSDFKKVQKELEAAGEPLRANPRNHSAGGIRQFKDPKKVAMMRLSFIAVGIEGLDNPPYRTEFERAIWVNKHVGMRFVRVEEFQFKHLAEMEKHVPELDYAVDGVVIGINSLEDQEQLGRHGDTPTGNPRGKIAWKFAEERAKPKTDFIEWKTGRTGVIKPVANFEPCPLAGTHVRRATLHNIGFMFRNKIKTGTQIVILKAGSIIPKVVGVESGRANYKTPEDVERPLECPSCGHPTTIIQNGDMYELVCESMTCSAQSVRGLHHYLRTFGVLGLGPSTVNALVVEGGKVKEPADFYKLTETDVMECGLSERESLLVLAGIHMIPSPDAAEDTDLKLMLKAVGKQKKSVPLWKLFASLGIESAGKSAGKALVDHFKTLDAIRTASTKELSEVPGVGDKTADVVHDYLKTNADAIDRLLKHVEPELPKTGGILEGKTFCLTGGFVGGKDAWEKKIDEAGGRCSSSVSKTTSFLVVGVDAGSKEQKADKLGVKKISPDELEKMLKG